MCFLSVYRYSPLQIGPVRLLCSRALFFFPKGSKTKKPFLFSLHVAKLTLGSCHGPEPVACSPLAGDHLPLLCLYRNQHSRQLLPYIKTDYNHLLFYPVATFPLLHSGFFNSLVNSL